MAKNKWGSLGKEIMQKRSEIEKLLNENNTVSDIYQIFVNEELFSGNQRSFYRLVTPIKKSLEVQAQVTDQRPIKNFETAAPRKPPVTENGREILNAPEHNPVVHQADVLDAWKAKK